MNLNHLIKALERVKLCGWNSTSSSLIVRESQEHLNILKAFDVDESSTITCKSHEWKEFQCCSMQKRVVFN